MQGSARGFPEWLADRGQLFIALLVLVALGIFAGTRLALALYTGTNSVPLSGWPRFLAMGLATTLRLTRSIRPHRQNNASFKTFPEPENA